MKRDDEDVTRKHPRGEAVVQAVIGATLDTLGAVGYEALTIDEVAKRAGVNKTTVYRRWATKPELVMAAMVSIQDEFDEQDTGALRSDLLVWAQSLRALVLTPRGAGLVRAMASGNLGAELYAVFQQVHGEFAHRAFAPVQRAIARGDLPADTDSQLLEDVISSVIMNRIIFDHREADDAYLEALVDLVLHGATKRPR